MSGLNDLMMDDDSDNDSDYRPEEDETRSIGDDGADSDGKKIEEIGFRRKRKANELYEEMLAQDKAYVETRVANSLLKKAKPSILSLEIPVSREKKRLNVFLRNYLGIKPKTRATRSSSSRFVVDVDNDLEELGGVEEEAGEEGKDSDIRKAALNAIAHIKKKTLVEETRKFAGKEITILKTVSKSATEVNQSIQQQKSKSSIDKALDAIKGPKAISTVTKSSVDWQNYKEKEGLEEDLAKATKNGYLDRKDFLDRCDVRNFEQERDIRLQNANKNA